MILRFIRRVIYKIKAQPVIQPPQWPVSMYNVSLFHRPEGDERGELQ